MKNLRAIIQVMFVLVIFLAAPAGAEEASAEKPYSGDIWTRSTLTGDWGGLRNDLDAKGVTLDMDITQVGQGVVNGGKSGQWQYGGRGDIILNLDSQKLGLWPGAFLNMEGEGNWASAVNLNTGALMPVNLSQVLPLPGQNFYLDSLNFAQFLSPYFGLTIGKYATITANSGDMNEFAHGKGDTQFMNMAFNINPVVAFTVPYSTLGTGVIVLPTKDPKEAIVEFLVLQANGTAATAGFNDLSGNQLTFVGSGRLRTDFFGLTGHQLFGYSFSNRDFTSIDQRFGNILQNQQLAGTTHSWGVFYNFDQYLYEPKKGSGEGIGIFGRFGASDGNPNFMHFFYSLGFGGKGVIPGRERDRYGLGFYFINVSNPTLQGPFQTRKFLRDEYGFEGFYDVAITPWLLLTPDIQVVRGAQKDKITIRRDIFGLPFIASQKSIPTATVLGFRLQVVF
ncbi:MAG TPA: carbohydrate porin [Candidatus Binatia bacterium]